MTSGSGVLNNSITCTCRLRNQVLLTTSSVTAGSFDNRTTLRDGHAVLLPTSAKWELSKAKAWLGYSTDQRARERTRSIPKIPCNGGSTSQATSFMLVTETPMFCQLVHFCFLASKLVNVFFYLENFVFAHFITTSALDVSGCFDLNVHVKNIAFVLIRFVFSS